VTAKTAQAPTVEPSTAFLETHGSGEQGRGLALAINPALALRVRGEFAEMPGLRLTVLQAARLFGVAPDMAHAVLEDLRRAAVLTYSHRKTYSLSC